MNIIVVSAWTGGHIFPAISILNEIKRRVEKLNVIFITNKKGPVVEILPKYGYKVLILEIKNPYVLLYAFFRAYRIVKKISPDFILGMGGMLSAPFCIIGKIMNVPVFVHEQNLFPGLTNRLLYRLHFIDKIFISFKETEMFLRGKGVIYSGNPVRKEFFQIEAKEKKDVPTIFVMGGSQGSVSINRAFLDAVSLMKREGEKIRIIHQTGRIDLEDVKRRYRELEVDAYIFDFIEDIPSILRDTDLVISRAGASTIFELSASGTPSILIPYPFAKEDHQRKNALLLRRLGAAEVIYEEQLTGRRLKDKIEALLNSPEMMKEMKEKVKGLANPDSAKIIADHILSLVAESIL